MDSVGEHFGEFGFIHGELLSIGTGSVMVGIFKGKRQIKYIAVRSGLTQQSIFNAVMKIQII